MAKSVAKKLRDDAVGSTPVAIPLSFGEKMLAGAIARGVAQTFLHPVDVLRTRMQAKGVQGKFNFGVLIKGVIPQITLSIPAGAIQFVAFEAAKEKLSSLFPDDKSAQVRVLAAGAFGALAAASCRVPQEVLKQRLQVGMYPNTMVAVREMLRTDGPGGLYRGWLATLSRDIPWNGLSFMFHGQGKQLFRKWRGRGPAHDENLVVAGVAGAIAAVIMTPIDVVKTRLMTQPTGSAQYSGIVGTVRKIVAEEGALTLMKGVAPRIIFLAPLAGITFSVYEAVAANIRTRKAASAPQSASTDGDIGRAPLAFAVRPAQIRRSKNLLSRLHTAMQANSGQTTLGDYASAHPTFFTMSA